MTPSIHEYLVSVDVAGSWEHPPEMRWDIAFNEINEAKRFKYIPRDELNDLYDGVNMPYQENLTWWVRFFDYL